MQTLNRLARWIALGAVCVLPVTGSTQTTSGAAQKASKHAVKVQLHERRASRLDLEVAGDLKGHFAGETAYLRRTDLLALPQVEFTVADDPNLVGGVKVRGVELDVLAREFAAQGAQALVVAVSKDFYRGYYPQDYREIHKPVLVLEVNGKPPLGWPKSREGAAMGPFVITHEKFTPRYKIHAHAEEPHIPWGVVRLEFTDEKATYAPIAPRESGEEVEAGYRIARENCLRCHAPGDVRTKGTLSWSVLGMIAGQSPQQFAAYVMDPKSVNEQAEMPGNPDYDEETLEALIAYFREFDMRKR
jgi:mono/diheme cytochrome c family protein